MDDTPLNYGCIGEGKTVEETISDFKDSYEEIKAYAVNHNEPFEELEYTFYYDIASFLEEYVKAFSLAGLERITGVNQTQLGHYLHGRRKPSKKVIDKMEAGVHAFAKELTAITRRMATLSMKK